MRLSRRDFAALGLGALTAAGLPRARAAAQPQPVLAEFGYGDVALDSAAHRAQIENTHEVLMSLSEDSLLRPFRQMAGLPAPGQDLGGWYNYDPDFDWHRDDAGFAPGATFGQWVSALARYYAVTGSEAARAKVLRLNRLYAASISEDYYDRNRFPAYCYDKLVLGLIDSHQFAQDAGALRLLERTTAAALPHLPLGAIDRELPWRSGKDQSYRWDESYTNPENLFLAYRRGAGARYRELALRFLDDASWFDPLARGDNVLADKHAYSYVNSLSSAMQAYLTLGSGKHLRAARNAFDMLSAQSYPTGGWGPDEKLVAPQSDSLFASLAATHNSFETPCGAYAHFKLTRYLLRVTRDARYGDSMERVMYNTVLGARPLRADGHAFYYADYNNAGRKVYSNHRFPCCSGTLPQVATDYGINAYLHDGHDVYVNLYLPSRLRWQRRGVRVTLQQRGDYPFGDAVSLRVGASRPQHFTVHLRIPAWAAAARVTVNGRVWDGAAEPGTFAALRRSWRDGDRIELELPRRTRLEALDTRHPDTVALLAGPLVLFPIRSGAEPRAAQRAELLAARQTAPRRWEAVVGGAAVSFLPYVTIDEEAYSTLLAVSG
ncbi:MAG TPA: beta-L-arabinofuranosidase domain-containing protein [Steroidobacteraceae bacterium]|nr:beta-L-arabinofuranosidase domain-containing protein [Steroidobacteraceae bacterium]